MLQRSTTQIVPSPTKQGTHTRLHCIEHKVLEILNLFKLFLFIKDKEIFAVHKKRYSKDLFEQICLGKDGF